MAPLPPREQTHRFLRYEGLNYIDEDIADFEERLERIYGREMHRVQVVDFQGMPELMRDGLFARMAMEHHDDASIVVFTSQAWERMFDIRGPLIWELILEFLSTLSFSEVLLDLRAPGTIQFQLGGVKRCLSWRQFILALGLHTEEEMGTLCFARYWSESERMIRGKGDLHDYWRDISTDEDFLGPPPSYTLIRDPVLRLCHRMMAYNIVGRSQTPKKELTVITPELPVIDMAKLVRLQIYVEIEDTWAWAPQQPPPPPLVAGRTMPQRLWRLEVAMHGLHKDVVGLRRLVDRSITDQTRFSTWMISCMTQLMEASGQTYLAFDGTF
ncbi:hypothetical protein Tco_0815848 [Tanacetum coccineum]